MWTDYSETERVKSGTEDKIIGFSGRGTWRLTRLDRNQTVNIYFLIKVISYGIQPTGITGINQCRYIVQS